MANEINIGINTTSDLSGLDKVDESVKSLRQQIKEATANVAILSDKFGATSKEAIEAAKAAAILKDRMGDAKTLTDAFNPDAKFKSLVGSLTGVAGGFSAVTGAMGILGGKSKDVEQAIAKVNQAMALASGVQALGESIDSFKTLATVIKSTTVFQRIATAAQWLWNAALNANPIGAVVVAVTALIGVGYLMIKMFKSTNETLEVSKENIEKYNKRIEAQTTLLENNRKKKQELQEFELRLMKAQGKSDEAIAKRAILMAAENKQEAAKEYGLKKSTLELYKNIIATHASTQALLENKVANETWGTNQWVIANQQVEDQKKLNEIKLKDAKEHIASSEKALQQSVIVYQQAKTNELKANQDLIVLQAQQQTNANKATLETKKETVKQVEKVVSKAELERQAKQKEQADKEAQALKEQQDLIKSLHVKFASDVEKIEYNSEVEKAEAAHKSRLKEIDEVKDFLQKQILLGEEFLVYKKELKQAELTDEEKTNNQIKELREKLIKEVEDISINGQRKKLQDKYDADVAEINQIKDQNEKIKLLGELKKQYDSDSQKIEIEQRAATIDAIGKMAVGAAEIGSFIADRLKGDNVKDKGRLKTAVRVGAASSIAGVIGSTMSANAGFLANPASIATMGLAAAVPIATNIASSLVAVANILSQKNKAIAEIDNAGSGDSGGGGSTPSKFATGGLVQGMGTSTSDSIMANLSNGESVINAKSTAMFGNLLSNINQMGGGVSFGTQSQANPIFKTYVVASEMTSQIEANLKLKQIARL
jgi:hypothetical protein